MTAAPPPPQNDAGPVELPIGKCIARRWKIIEKLGEGGCGAVYLVEDNKSKTHAALKAESNFVVGGSVLKLEAQVLKRLVNKKFVAQLITAGKKEKYCYMVMTLFGHSLARLFKHCKKEFSLSTQIRLGQQMLYGLKQLHEVGYVHRDLKPANLAIGKKGKATRVLHLLDFGLSREYIIKNAFGKIEIRKPRENTLFRGTTKYCSANSHTKAEQGRPDDLWSMVYVLAEMRGPLPWDSLRDKHEIGRVKQSTIDEKLLQKCSATMLKITAHLRELNYFTRPDYLLLYKIFEEIMKEHDVKHSDPFDWELLGPIVTEKKALKKRGRIVTVTEDVSVAKTAEQPVSGHGTGKENSQEQDENNNDAPFTMAEFEKNEIGV